MTCKLSVILGLAHWDPDSEILRLKHRAILDLQDWDAVDSLEYGREVIDSNVIQHRSSTNDFPGEELP